MSALDLLQEISLTELTTTTTVTTVTTEDSKTSFTPANNAGIVESETPAKMKQCLLHFTTVGSKTPSTVVKVVKVVVVNKENEKSHVSEKLDSESAFELFSERAAIQEYDGGLDRLEAERQAFYWVWERAS